MINQTRLAGISGTVTTSVGAKEAAPDLGFEALITERTNAPESGDSAFTEEVMAHILRSIASMHEGSKNIWEIVLQLEEHVDPELSDEMLNMDFDNTAGLNGIAGLLARYWKKKELLGENDTASSFYRSQNAIDNRAASELSALLRRKERRLIAEIRESVTDA